MISFFRTIIMYIIVVISMRCMGKRQIGQLQPYEVVIALIIADLATFPMEDNSVPLLNGIIPILSLLLAQIVISFLLYKSGKLRRLFCGSSKVVIKNGKINEEVLSGEMYTVSDLTEAMRINGCTDLRDVLEARLETNGELSVICTEDAPLVEDIIVCGRIIQSNYDSVNVDGDALLREIKKLGGHGVNDVLYAGASAPCDFVIQLKSNVVKKGEHQ